MVLVPKKGAAWNPLLKYPRNLPCMCGSGFKFKQCCYKKLPRAVPKDWADAIEARWQDVIDQKIKFAHHEKKKHNPLTWRDPKPPVAKED